MATSVGRDFVLSDIDYLKDRNVDMSGIRVEDGKTSGGRDDNGFDLNQAITLKTELNVIKNLGPPSPPVLRMRSLFF